MSQHKPVSIDDIDHVNVKIFAREPVEIQLGDAIPVFHRWIQDSVTDELLIDVADYAHVPAGPGVLLIGHQADYSLDLTFNRLGLLYNRKQPVPGAFRDKLRQAFSAALIACSRLEEEAPFRQKLHFDAGQMELILNDRLLAPNTVETWNAVRPELEAYLNGLFDGRTYSLAHVGEARERFRVQICAAHPVPASELLLAGRRS